MDRFLLIAISLMAIGLFVQSTKGKQSSVVSDSMTKSCIDSVTYYVFNSGVALGVNPDGSPKKCGF